MVLLLSATVVCLYCHEKCDLFQAFLGTFSILLGARGAESGEDQ
jgi:hypothetical protein